MRPEATAYQNFLNGRQFEFLDALSVTWRAYCKVTP